MLLTEAEIVSLTDRTRHGAQARALRAMGIDHKQRPDGSLAVLRSHVEHLLGGTQPAKASTIREPNWGAVNA